MSKIAIVILTHFFDEHIADMFHRMRAETSALYDIFIALNLGEGELRMPDADPEIQNHIFLCNAASLLELPYPEKCNPAGWSGKGWKAIDNVDTIMLSFYRASPEYAFYWGIEYDVHYQGKWGFLFRRFESSEADLLGVMLDSAAKTSNKILMPPFRDDQGVQPDYEDAIVGFYPIHRLSHRMIRRISACYQSGWNGHYEFTWGTIARQWDMEIEDIGGDGPYVKAHNRNVFYFNTIGRWDMSPGTFVFRPAFSKILKRENTLWHPVKPNESLFNHCPALPEKTAYGWAKRIVKRLFYGTAIRFWFLFCWRPAASTPEPWQHRSPEQPPAPAKAA